jgi:hypothetical protein
VSWEYLETAYIRKSTPELKATKCNFRQLKCLSVPLGTRVTSPSQSKVSIVSVPEFAEVESMQLGFNGKSDRSAQVATRSTQVVTRSTQIATQATQLHLSQLERLSKKTKAILLLLLLSFPLPLCSLQVHHIKEVSEPLFI